MSAMKFYEREILEMFALLEKLWISTPK